MLEGVEVLRKSVYISVIIMIFELSSRYTGLKLFHVSQEGDTYSLVYFYMLAFRNPGEGKLSLGRRNPGLSTL